MGNSINIAFVGDIMPGGVFVRTGGVGKDVLDYLSSFDIRIGTLESAFGDGTTLCHKKNTPTLGTIIFSPDERISMLLDLGINAVSLANNHSCDCDLQGLYHTMELLDKYGISHFGAGHTVEEAAAPAVIHCKGKTICLLGYLQDYHYFYGRRGGYIPTDKEGGYNIFNIDKVLKDVKYFKDVYDYVFVMPHWGTEGSVFPKMKEVKYARKIIAAGADGVIGSHAHIVQPVLKYRKKVIAMNLGNFAFPDRYVIKPRISYYPTDEELASQNIPVVNSFKLVETLSYKKVAKTQRIGMVLGVRIENSINSKKYYTELLENNTIVHRNKYPLAKLIPFYVKCLTKDSARFVLHSLQRKTPYKTRQ